MSRRVSIKHTCLVVSPLNTHVSSCLRRVSSCLRRNVGGCRNVASTYRSLAWEYRSLAWEYRSVRDSRNERTRGVVTSSFYHGSIHHMHPTNRGKCVPQL